MSSSSRAHSFPPPSLVARSRLSLQQIQTVLSRFFPSENSVYLLLVPTSPLSSPNPFTPTKRVTDSFRFDLADDGQPYGHFYEGLDLVRDVSGKVVVHKGEGGRWELGELAF